MLQKIRAWRAEGRARRGAQFFDAHEPGWANTINERLLDMYDNRWCVFGQIMRCTANPRMFATKYGLWRSAGHVLGVCTLTREMASALEEAWRREIRRRRNAAA